MLTVPDPTGQEPQGIFPHLESPLVRDLMLLLEYDASPECARIPLTVVLRTPQTSRASCLIADHLATVVKLISCSGRSFLQCTLTFCTTPKCGA